MHIKWNEYTWYSKLAAAVFFIVIFPQWMFYLGMRYEEYIQIIKLTQNTSSTLEKQVMFETITEGNFKIPQLKDFSNPEIQTAVNDDIKNYYREGSCLEIYTIGELQDQLRIRQTYEENKLTDAQIAALTEDQLIHMLDFYYSVDSKVTYAENDIFSIHIENDSYCGGAHPSSADISITYDLKTGKRVPFEQLFATFQKDTEVLGSIFLNQKTNASKESMSVAECTEILPRYMDKENLKYASYYLTKEGVVIVPSLPHAAYVCTRGYIVPVKAIKTYINPAGILSRFEL